MNKKFLIIIFISVLFLLSACSETKEHEFIDRESKIPSDAVKMTPEMDNHPPVLHSDEYENPVPLAYPINTKGAEDSPFFADDKLYFFFTPDVDVSVEKQVIDGVTGIYVSDYKNGAFQNVERVWLQDAGKLSLDGCGFVRNNEFWFCSAREGYTGLHWVKAEFKDGEWKNWKVSDFDSEFEVGELHIYENELYYHSSKSGGNGGTDIWMIENIDGEWKNPVNIEAVNSAENEGMPYITPDGKELWFNRQYQGTPAVFRNKKINGEWQEPELIISTFAGEPTLDDKGNVYFVHHFYEDGKMIEADIYVAYKK